MRRKIAVGVSGASGSIYAHLLLKSLSQFQDQIEDCILVFTDSARQVWKEELPDTSPPNEGFSLHNNADFNAPIASGSSRYDTLILIPCSMGTMARIANGISSDLLSRAGDVFLKERRRLILVPRESPINLIQAKNQLTLLEAGAHIVPASPSFYHKPKTVEELAMTVVSRVLRLAGFDDQSKAWGEK